MQDKHPEEQEGMLQEEENTMEWRPQDADREMVKRQIRDRVRSAKVADNAVFIPARPEPKVYDDGQKMVAAYTRVSTLSTEQVSSIENQTRFYTEKIEKNPNWTLQKIYSDEGKSGTSMKKRTAFRQMLQDARDNKMDLILCASVSRFARNVSDCMEQVRELRTQNPSHPVGVYFETENIYTLDPASHQALSMHAMLADWESANKSRRMIISYDQRICMGQYPLADGLGYRHTKDGKISIEPEEAKTVRYIFLSFISGDSCRKIADDLTRMGRRTIRGRSDWNESMVHSVMLNERRWGDLSVRKTVVIDYVKGTTVKNDQIRDAAFVSGHHEGIVSPEIAKAAHLIMESSHGYTGGVAGSSVITDGALKGFVSISPSWRGIDMESLSAICRAAYTEEEYGKLQVEERIRSGKGGSSVTPIDMSGYQVPNGSVFMNRQTPALTMTERSIKINRKVHEKLGDCPNAEFLYHPVLKMLAIREAGEVSENAIAWNTEGRRLMHIPASAFCRAVYEIMDWIPAFGFRFRGITRERDGAKVMVFYLDEPQILPDKAAKEACGSDGGPAVKYIPYHNAEVNGNENNSAGKTFGLPVAARRVRDKLIGNISGQDIRRKATSVVNPMIGDIPDRDKIRHELDALAATM